jgi:hypothetical protein
LILALLPLLDVCIQANIFTLVRVKTNEAGKLLLRRLVLLRLDSAELGDIIVDLADFVELVWIVLEYPLEQLDVPLDEDALELLEELGRLESLTRNIERKIIGWTVGQHRASLLYKGGCTVNDDLEPADPLRQPMLAEFLGDEDAFDHKSDILLTVLGTLPELIRDRARNENDSLERYRAGIALEVVPGKGVLVVLESCLVKLPVLLVGDVLGVTVAYSEAIQFVSLSVTHRVQSGAWLFS